MGWVRWGGGGRNNKEEEARGIGEMEKRDVREMEKREEGGEGDGEEEMERR